MLCFLFNIKVFGLKTKNLERNMFWSKGGLQQNGVFLWTCVLENVKSYRFFFGHFFGNSWLMFKKHRKNRYFSTFLKAKKWKKMTISKVNNWATCKVNNWATFGPLKNRQRGPVINFANFGFPFFIFKKICWNPYFYSVFWKTIFYKKQTWPSY